MGDPIQGKKIDFWQNSGENSMNLPGRKSEVHRVLAHFPEMAEDDEAIDKLDAGELYDVLDEIGTDGPIRQLGLCMTRAHRK